MSRLLGRVVEILDTLAGSQPALSLAEISSATGLDHSTAYRLLGSLASYQLVRRDPSSKRYSLGSGVIVWGARALESIDVRAIADPALRHLNQQTQETVTLYVRDGLRRICVTAYHSPLAVRSVPALGTTLPLTRGAGGQITLAHLPRADAEAIIGADDSLSELERACLWDALPEIRRRGYGLVVNETVPDSWSMAAAVFDRAGDVPATIVIAAPTNRLDEERVDRFAGPLVDAAAEVSLALGAPPTILVERFGSTMSLSLASHAPLVMND